MTRTATTRDDSRLFTLMAQTPASEETRAETDIDFDLVTRRWKERRETELAGLRLWRDAFEQRLQNVEVDLRNLTGEFDRLAALLSDNIRLLQNLVQSEPEKEPTQPAQASARTPNHRRTDRRPVR